MRSVWNGTIRLGLASIPVKAYGATEEQGTGLHHVHATDGGRVRHRRICEVDGAEVELGELARGYVLPGGETVVLTEEDFAKLPLPTSRAIEVQAFAQVEEIDPIYFARSYHLEPEPAGVKSYVLLSEALRRSGRVAVVKIALRQKESLAVLRVRDQVIVLETMLWPDEIRTPEFPFLHQEVAISDRDARGDRPGGDPDGEVRSRSLHRQLPHRAAGAGPVQDRRQRSGAAGGFFAVGGGC
jgi:DNA end-binding protein Ku